MKKIANIKKNDTVQIITGNDRGKTGKVVRVLRDSDRVVVEGVNVRKKHRRPTPTDEGGIVEQEMPVHVSNVRPLNPETGEPTSFGRKVLDDGTWVRYCKKTGQRIE